MVDPDAPSKDDPKYRMWRHWLVTEIPGLQLIGGKELSGIDLTEYRRPTPPPGTGYHRYQFLLFNQPPGASLYLHPEESTRASWDVDVFIERFQLGHPLATTQFMVKNDLQ
ncbi:hypothetical protein GDO86_006761 [Hymenochirus boettgeri]|nr:hypothetical protein GDO86_006761 [Hymenochirus boettgeri]